MCCNCSEYDDRVTFDLDEFTKRIVDISLRNTELEDENKMLHARLDKYEKEALEAHRKLDALWREMRNSILEINSLLSRINWEDYDD